MAPRLARGAIPLAGPLPAPPASDNSKVHPLRTSLTAILLVVSALPGLAQSLNVAPSTTEGDRIRRLVGQLQNEPLTITIRGFARGDTDVIPLDKASERHGVRRIYNGTGPYFDAYESESIEASRGLWRFGYSWTRADLYQGNHDAAQVYLDSQSGSLTDAATGSPRATMNKTSATRWQLGYQCPLTIAGHRAELYAAASYLRMQRVQLGSLTGSTTGDAFAGTLSFLSTLDMDPSETHSDGLSVDAGLCVQVDDRWRISLQCENLASRVWQRGLQSIVADVATNTIVADEDGFLYGAPLVSGTTSRTNLRTELRRRIDVGGAYRQDRTSWVAFFHRDFSWRLAGGLTQDLGHGSRWWALLWCEPFEWQAGIDWGMLRLAMGMSDVNASTTERASVSLALRVCLEKKREARSK